MCVSCNMADRRTLTKRNGQRKVLESLIERASTIVEGGSSRCPEKELAALVKNIKSSSRRIPSTRLVANSRRDHGRRYRRRAENFVGIGPHRRHRIGNSDGLSQKTLTRKRRKSCCVNFSGEVSPVSSISARNISLVQSEVGCRHADNVSSDQSDFGTKRQKLLRSEYP